MIQKLDLNRQVKHMRKEPKENLLKKHRFQMIATLIFASRSSEEPKPHRCGDEHPPREASPQTSKQWCPLILRGQNTKTNPNCYKTKSAASIQQQATSNPETGQSLNKINPRLAPAKHNAESKKA